MAGTSPHAHHHDHGASRPPDDAPRFSMLRLSFAERLGGVAVLLVLLWGCIWWALA